MSLKQHERENKKSAEPFIMIPLALYESAQFQSLTPAERCVAVDALRALNFAHKVLGADWVVYTYRMSRAGVGRHTFYAAMQRLVELGFLECDKKQGGKARYRLSENWDSSGGERFDNRDPEDHSELGNRDPQHNSRNGKRDPQDHSDRDPQHNGLPRNRDPQDHALYSRSSTDQLPSRSTHSAVRSNSVPSKIDSKGVADALARVQQALTADDALNAIVERVKRVIPDEPTCWLEWYSVAFGSMASRPGGVDKILELVERVEQAADPQQRESKGIGAFTRPGRFLVRNITEWLKARGATWPDFPADFKRRTA